MRHYTYYHAWLDLLIILWFFLYGADEEEKPINVNILNEIGPAFHKFIRLAAYSPGLHGYSYLCFAIGYFAFPVWLATLHTVVRIIATLLVLFLYWPEVVETLIEENAAICRGNEEGNGRNEHDDDGDDDEEDEDEEEDDDDVDEAYEYDIIDNQI
ncbi:unnamed protein product [Caenorhabditis sp. 36 PRJEB53466]|nr:unnamed protein product [Caenorhabditis sp. 36 PRJEB53466]